MKKSRMIAVAALAALLAGCRISVSENASAKTSTSTAPVSDSASASVTSPSVVSDSASTSVVKTYAVKKVLNLSPDFFTLSVKEKDTYQAGTYTLTLTAGSILSSGFLASSNHLDHIYVTVNDTLYKPTFATGVTFSKTVDMTLTMPAADSEIVACYSVQQHLKTDGHAISFEANDKVKAYGVSSTEKYDYIDCYAVCDPSYKITKAEYRLSKDTTNTWIEIGAETSAGTSLTAQTAGQYELAIRPNSQDLTDDVVVRFTGEQHTQRAITYPNLVKDYLVLDSSVLPETALNGDSVTVTLQVKSGAYLKSLVPTGISDSDISYATKTNFTFTMPDNDVSFAITFADSLTITTVANSKIQSVSYYTDDPGYTDPTEKANPGDTLWIKAVPVSADEVFASASVNGGEAVTVGGDGYVHLSIPDDATAISITLATQTTYTATLAVGANGTATLDRSTGKYAKDDTVTLEIRPTLGYELDAITFKDSSNQALLLTLTAGEDVFHQSFVMPECNVTVSVSFKELANKGTKITLSANTYTSDDLSFSITTDGTTYDTLPASIDAGTSLYVSAEDGSANFHVKIQIGTTIECDKDAALDEDSGSYSFGHSILATADTTITLTQLE
jgi:hypothetical protein